MRKGTGGNVSGTHQLDIRELANSAGSGEGSEIGLCKCSKRQLRRCEAQEGKNEMLWGRKASEDFASVAVASCTLLYRAPGNGN